MVQLHGRVPNTRGKLLGGVRRHRRRHHHRPAIIIVRMLGRALRGRLAVLLGLKPDDQVQVKKQDPQFTDMEVNLLKTLLVKLSNGATEKYKEAPPEVIQKDNKINSVSEVKTQTIAPLTGPKQVQKIAVNKPAQTVQPSRKPLPKNPNKIKSRFEQIKEMEAELEATSKPFQEMNQQEKEERNRQISKLEALKKPPRPAAALPMPSLDQSNMLYNMQSQNTTAAMLAGPMGKALGGK